MPRDSPSFLYRQKRSKKARSFTSLITDNLFFVVGQHQANCKRTKKGCGLIMKVVKNYQEYGRKNIGSQGESPSHFASGRAASEQNTNVSKYRGIVSHDQEIIHVKKTLAFFL